MNINAEVVDAVLQAIRREILAIDVELDTQALYYAELVQIRTKLGSAHRNPAFNAGNQT